MPDEITNIADVIEPAIWLPYAIQRSVELSRFHQAGIVEQSDEFASLVDEQSGTLVNMPFWNDLTGNAEVIKPTGRLTTKKIGSAQDMAQIHNLGSAWAVHDLAKYFAGSDPATAIADLVGGFWARDTQDRVLSTLKGVFASSSMSSNVAHIYHTSGGAGSSSALNRFNAESFMDATQLLGDHQDSLVSVAMHSAVHTSIKKQGLIDTIPDDTGRPITYFQGLRIVIDDGMPSEVIDGDAVYTSYIFGRGALAMGIGKKNHKEMGMAPDSTWQIEFSRDALAHVSNFINRRRWILHPRGVRWTSSSLANKSGAEFAELENGNNWDREYDQKNIRIVEFKTNIL